MKCDPGSLRQRISLFAGNRLLMTLVALAFIPAVLFVGPLRVTPLYAAENIKDIVVSGNRRVEADTIRSYLQFTQGDPYDPAKVDGSLKALFSTGLFSDVKIDRQGNSVLVSVVENPVVNQVVFEGNSEVDTDTLRTEVQLKPRSVYTKARAQSDVQRILELYSRQGRFAASVDPKLIELEEGRVNVVFEIEEGVATKVKGINFVGNHVFSDEQLRDVISTTQSGWFDFLKGTSIYDPDRQSLDRELLRQYYLKNGYADARVVSANAELDREGTGFLITYAVEEGERYTFGQVSVENSLQGLKEATVTSQMLTHQGQIYNAADVDKSVEKMTLATAEQGFPFARVRPRAIPDQAARTISIVYTIDEGPRIYIERINVVGNLRTKDKVIRREFRLAEGDAFNPLMVDRAKKRLEGLGIFKKVDIKRRPGSAQDRVILDVEVEEQSTGELSFGAGFSTNEGLIGDVSITERNFLGNGQFLRLKLAGSFQRMQADLSFTEPRFLDQNIAAGFDIYYKNLYQTQWTGYSSNTMGGSPRIGFPLAENLWMQLGYTIKYDEITSVANNTSAAVKQSCGTLGTSSTSCSGDGYWTSSTGISLTYDKRNHPRNPTSGYYMQLSSDFAGLGGDAQYIRSQGETRAYYPITDKITFVGRAVGGNILPWGGQDVRLLDLYYRGGETVRGFNYAGFGPRDLETGFALGGQTFWATTAEVRFPIPFVPDDLGLGGAVFADAGSLFGLPSDVADLKCTDPGCGENSFDPVDGDTLRASVGASFIWNSPMGPLRLDYAVPFQKESYDRVQNLRFGASSRF